ncbi:MAG: squalene/phytoene synthase family protein [Leptolyngbyaceae cyanobacterium bins.302]|nr:squalene/phytoene synthase family protein [Leptolyngbyaceae cyanobacterium bins.302]
MKLFNSRLAVAALESPVEFDAASNFTQYAQPQTIATLIGSSDYHSISDDSLKDEDNAGWVMQLEDSVRQEWVERIRWIRLVDRLAEQELICPAKAEFQQFLGNWQMLLHTGTIDGQSPYAWMLQAIRDRWFDAQGQPLHQQPIHAWNQYLSALDRYNATTLEVYTCECYEQMLTDLAGAFFQVLPFLPERYGTAACHFGVVDQFYNHLRDLQEDAVSGICYFPNELLDWFGVRREEILQQTAPQNSNYRKMMQFWLNEYLPRLRWKVRHLRTASDVPLSWKVLGDWSMYRYRRIEQVFRECEFDYTLFPQIYWQRVREELPVMLDQVKTLQAQLQAQNASGVEYAHLRGWKKLTVLSSYVTQLQSLSASAI